MAVLTPDTDSSNHDRGQLLAIAAVGLALLLAVMALVLNTAVFGEIHVAQTDESQIQERGAMQYQESVRRGVTEIILSLNENHTAYDDIADVFETELSRWDALTRQEYERDSVVTNVTLVTTDYRHETWIIQDESPPRKLTDDRGRSSWTLAENVTEINEFELNVTADELIETDDCAADGACFTMTIEGGDGETWWMELYTKNDQEGIALTVDSSTTGTDNCETTDATVSMNVTNGTFDDGSCEFTPFTAAVNSSYTLRYDNADNVTGTYQLRVDGKIEDDERYASSGSPRLEHEVVGIETATVRIRYRSVTLQYETDVRVDPGETHG